MIYVNNTAHWYRPDGTPAYEATLREARKETLYPSVTTVLKMMAKPELDAWKQRELLSVAVTTPRKPEQTDDEYARTIVDLYGEKQGVAMKRGSAIHDEIEGYITCKRMTDISPQAKMAIDLLHEHKLFAPQCEQSYATIVKDRGYGGKVDLAGMIDTRYAIVDYKTQTIKVDKKGIPKPTIYEEMGIQLSAYRKFFDGERDCYNLIIGTNMPYVHLHKWEEEDLDNCAEMFYDCLDLFYRVKGL